MGETDGNMLTYERGPIPLLTSPLKGEESHSRTLLSSPSLPLKRSNDDKAARRPGRGGSERYGL